MSDVDPFDFCVACQARIDAWLASKPAEHKAPLTREKILRAMHIFGVYNIKERDKALKIPASIEDAILDEWTSFYFEHAPELLAFAMVGLDRLDPEKRGGYQKHTLGPIQSKIVGALAGGPLQHREILEATGSSDRNLRQTLVSLVARGTIARGWDQLREVVLYALPGTELAPVPAARKNTGGAKMRAELTKAPKMGSDLAKWEPDPEVVQEPVVPEEIAEEPAGANRSDATQETQQIAPVPAENPAEAAGANGGSEPDESELDVLPTAPVQRQVRKPVPWAKRKAEEAKPVRHVPPPPAWMVKPARPPGRSP